MKTRILVPQVFLLLIFLSGCKDDTSAPPENENATVNEPASWISRADSSYNSLNLIYWEESKNVFKTDNKGTLNTQHYWWQAHALDAVVDAAERQDTPALKNQVASMVGGIKSNIGNLRNNDFFDDRIWMALALLRAYELTKDQTYLTDVQNLWEDIKLGWNSNHGGGIAWNENQLAYKNAPSNGPAAILAFRLYKLGKDENDLKFGQDIIRWQESTLVDPVTGIVWDGIGREGGNEIDGDQTTEDFWRFTYNQGTYVGALVELYSITKESALLEKALKTFNATKALITTSSGVIRPEGEGDGGLFKGIMIRYFGCLAVCEGLSDGDRKKVIDYIVLNGESAWDKSRNPAYPFLFNHDWRIGPAVTNSGQVTATIDLTVALSGVFLMETLADLEDKELLKAL